MAKVSIGLRGWRFDEADVFEDDGSLRPVDEMPDDVADRVSRLTALVTAPCDACYLIHGEADLAECGVAAVVYGEPMDEVILCPDHEADFVYWYREAGGREHRGEDGFRDAFHGWFADGGRAPEGYGGVEHVETDPDELPEPPDPAEADACGLDDRVDLDDAEDLDLGADYPTG